MCVMDINYSYCASTVGLLLVCCLLCVIECLEIKVREGDPIELTLPGIKTCGHYTLLNPSLRPVVIVEGSNATNLIDPYDKRASVTQSSEGFTLTLSQATERDAGEYTLAPSVANLAPPCISYSFHVNVTDAAASEEYFKPWGEWSFCIGQCSHYRKRSRSRKCSLEGGCGGMGATYQTETCDKAEHCPKWSSWGGWGECSAKCGKGFRIRKRVCLSAKSSLVRSSDCRGVSTQSHMCLTVCEVFGTWNEWSEWSNCTMTCGSDVTNGSTNTGTRTRSRACSTDGQRDVTRICTGNRTEEEMCSAECTSTIPIASTENITEAVFVGMTEAATERSINIISVIAGSACALFVVVVLIIVIVLKKRVTRRRESVPTLRPAESANNRRKKISKERKSSAPQNIPQNGSGNVYSEFNSNSFWPSSEFDSTYSLDNAGFSTSTFGNVMEVIGETSDGFDSEFDDSLDAAGGPVICERKEVIYEKSRASCQRTHAADGNVKYSDNQSAQSEDFVVTENECYEPPELWSNEDVRNSFGFDSLPGFGGVNTRNNGDNNQILPTESETVYYEPPIEDDVDDDASKRAEMKRQESEMTEDSIYENCEANRGTIASLEQSQCLQDTDEDYYEIPENKNLNSKQTSEGELIKDKTSEKLTNEKGSDETRFTQVNMRNGSVVSIDTRFLHLSKDDLDSEHTYVNGNAVNIKDFYVTPKYTYGQETKKSVRGSEHIYDIPKN